MTPGPFDAIGGFSHLETISLQPPAARDHGSDGSFAQHLSPPRASGPTKSEPRREEQRDASREQTPASASSTPGERPNRKEKSDQSTQNELSDAPAEEAALASSQPDNVVNAAAQVARQPEKPAANDDDQDEVLAVTDEVLLTVVAAPTVPAPVIEEPPVEEENAAAVAAIGEEGQQTKGGKQKVPTPPKASNPPLPDAIPANAQLDPARTMEETNVAQQTTTAVADVNVQTVTTLEEGLEQVDEEGERAEPVMSTMHARNAAGKKKSKENADQPAAEAVVEDVAGEFAVPEELRAENTRDGKKERQRGDRRDNAQGKEQLDATLTATTSTSAEVKPVEAAATAATLPLPEAPTTSDSATTPAPNGNTNTPPTLAENASAATRLPQHLLARNSTRASGGAPVTDAEQMRLVQRVAKAFQAAQSREDGEIRLRLSPPELGSLKLELKIEGGVLTARLEAETSSAKAVILDNLPTLKERLAEQGIQVEKFDVDLMDRRPTDQGQNDFTQQRERQSTAHTSRLPSGGREVMSAENNPPTSSSARNNTNDGRLNVTV